MELDLDTLDLDMKLPEPKAPPKAEGHREIVMVNIDTIQLREEDMRRQPQGVEELADSIYRIKLLNPIILDDKNTLIAGRCRLEAYKLLFNTYGDRFWQIPAQYFEELEPEEKQMIELDENVKRTQLHWKEKSHAVRKLFEFTKQNCPGWTFSAVCEYIGISENHVRMCTRVSEALNNGDARVEQAQGFVTACNILERDEKRKKDMQFNEIVDIATRAPVQMEEAEESIDDQFRTDVVMEIQKPKVPVQQFIRPEVDASIMAANFHEWASTYEGRKFNFIHCDFPYGINHGESDLGGANEHGGYDDSPDVYWALLKVLAENIDKIATANCHMMFWLSLKFDIETRRFFQENMPGWEIDYNPLIWLKSDNKGIIRNPERSARHVYESAYMITRGTARVCQNVADAYAAPTSKAQAIHLSEKPEPMLRHFFRLFVDEHTEILDPTAGGGSAIRAAVSMKAKRSLGIELNPEYAAYANAALQNSIKLQKGI